MTQSRSQRWLTRIFWGVAVLGLLVGGLFWGARRVPDFYREALERPVSSDEQMREAGELVQRTETLVEEVQNPGAWTQSFTESQINSWLATELVQQYGDQIPEGISNPRVKIIQGSLLVGFLYESTDYSGVISLELKPRLTGPRELTVEVVSLRAGALPVPLKSMLDDLEPVENDSEWAVRWSETPDGAEFEIGYQGELEQDAELTAVELDSKTIRISGETEKKSDELSERDK